ncbi:PilZ domain-containing protein [Methylotuvimicrobium sp. KM1]|uniref:PilZ domain-containing protein n=1 Tax=Methylotuvimicrobium sp. KM1 TaxID=3377707 RepID=UPI00385095D7
MADINPPSENHRDIFDLDTDDTIQDNGRRSVRYVRNDIKVVLISKNLLGLDKKIQAQLQDISSKGLRVSAEEKLSINKKITVALKFKDGRRFNMKAKVVRQSSSNKFDYGIKFEERQNDLGDHLLETQTDLLLK